MSVWKEFVWGALAGAIGETVMHPVDTLKTRIQSGSQFGLALQRPNDIRQVYKSIWMNDGVRGFYRGVVPGLTGSLVTGATYFGFIETTKDWLQETNPKLAGPWAHFVAGATGDTLGSAVYVPCEVMKQRMQVQGSRKGWQAAMEGVSTRSGTPGYQYYSSILQAGRAIIQREGFQGLYAGYLSTLARDVPFAGFQIMFYESFREAVEYGHSKYSHQGPASSVQRHSFSSSEELVLGGAAGGISAYLTTPMDVIKTRLQVQGSSARCSLATSLFNSI